MHPSAALAEELARLRSDMSNHVNIIARELLRHIGIDASSVQRSLSAITMLCQKVAQVFPKISMAKVEAQRGAADDPLVWVALDRSANELRGWSMQWPKIEELVRTQIPQKRRKLMIEPDETIASQLAQNDALFDQMHEMFKPQVQTADARDHGCFADISLPNSTFVAYAHAAHRALLAQRRKGPSRFLDVGCGTGFKLMAAARYFDRCDGLEYDPAYVVAAKAFLARGFLGTCSVFQADGMEYTGYDDYDVIYFYRPMREDDQLRLLEAQILKYARPGTLIIAPYKVFESRFREYDCARLLGWLYVAGTSQSDADILLKCAEMTGPFVGKIPPRGRGIWDPILASSVAKGFGH